MLRRAASLRDSYKPSSWGLPLLTEACAGEGALLVVFRFLKRLVLVPFRLKQSLLLGLHHPAYQVDFRNICGFRGLFCHFTDG